MRRPAASPDLRLRLGAMETRVPASEAVAPGARRDRGPGLLRERRIKLW